MHQALPGLCVFRGGVEGNSGKPGSAIHLPKGKRRSDGSARCLYEGKQGKSGEEPAGPICGKAQKGTVALLPLGLRRTGERDLTALLLIFHPNAGEAEGLFHEKFLPFKNLHILIQENKEKLSYTLEEDHYSIPTIPKARRQPAVSLIGVLWR